MDHSRIERELRCFVKLSTFNSFTGESFNKDCLNEKDKKEVTACEETIALLNGKPEEELTMPKEELKEQIAQIYNGLKKHMKETEQLVREGVINENVVNLEARREEIEGFKDALELLEMSSEDIQKQVRAYAAETAFKESLHSLKTEVNQFAVPLSYDDEEDEIDKEPDDIEI